MSLRHFMLGVLFETPNHGYALRKKHLGRIGHFRRINEGQLYTELAKMEKEGLIKREAVVPEKGPAKKLVHITQKGKQLFMDWLRSHEYEDEGVLYDFIQGFPFFSKLSFLNHLDADEVAEKIDRQLEIQRRKKSAYQEILEGMKSRGVEPLRVDILAFGLDEIEHRIRWLTRIGKELEKKPKRRR